MLRLVAAVMAAAACAAPCAAQAPVTSPEELQRRLAAGDVITVVTVSGQPVSGTLARITPDDVQIRLDRRGKQDPGGREIAIPFNAIRSLERLRDPVRNGALIGAGIGAGAGGAMFVTAFVIDRNEMDEWAPYYLGAAAVSTGIGALIGWAVDRSRSKPHLRFEAASGPGATLTIRPLAPRGVGIGLAVAF